MFSPEVPPFHRYFFSLGRGKPKQAIERLWFTYHGRILGSFKVLGLVVNDGSLPKLHRLDGGESDWQFKRDVWVVVCAPPCQRLRARVFHEPFRGWRYFDFDEYFTRPESRHRL